MVGMALVVLAVLLRNFALVLVDQQLLRAPLKVPVLGRTLCLCLTRTFDLDCISLVSQLLSLLVDRYSDFRGYPALLPCQRRHLLLAFHLHLP